MIEGSRIIVAADFPTLEQAVDLAHLIGNDVAEALEHLTFAGDDSPVGGSEVRVRFHGE